VKRNSLGSSGLARCQLGTGHPVEGKIELVRIAREDLKVSTNRIALNMRARQIGVWWSEEGEFGVVVLMVAMASGGRRRTEGVLWCLREGRRGHWKLQDGQLQLAKAMASC
jgi:hypothetical protein